jgi:hypothetical protein
MIARNMLKAPPVHIKLSEEGAKYIICGQIKARRKLGVRVALTTCGE